MTTAAIAINDTVSGSPSAPAQESNFGVGAMFARAAGVAWSTLKSVAKKAFNFAVAHPVVTTVGLLVAGNWLSGGALVAGAAMLPVMLGKWLLAKSASAAFSVVSPMATPIISGVQTLLTHSDAIGTAAKTAFDIAMPGTSAVIEGGKFIAQHPEIATTVAKTAIDVAAPAVIPALHAAKTVVENPGLIGTVLDVATSIAMPGLNFFR
jgi:hypothetical protein